MHKQYDWYSSDISILGVGPFFKHLCLVLNTQSMTNPTILSPVKMEYG